MMLLAVVAFARSGGDRPTSDPLALEQIFHLCNSTPSLQNSLCNTNRRWLQCRGACKTLQQGIRSGTKAGLMATMARSWAVTRPACGA
jgi:hypothetical protein